MHGFTRLIAKNHCYLINQRNNQENYEVMVHMQQPKTLPAYELLRRSLYGARIEVIAASNPVIVGLVGKLVHETRNTIIIKNEKNNEKIVEKKSCSFKINLQDYQSVIIHGKYLKGRLDERLKKYTRKK